MTLSFTVHGKAKPQGSMKGFVREGKVALTSDNAGLKFWRTEVREGARQAIYALPKDDQLAMTGGVRLSLVFYLPRPKSLGKRITAHLKKPDLDKLIRGCCDALSGLVYRDDSQVCEIFAAKEYVVAGEPSRVDINVHPKQAAGLFQELPE